MANEIRYQVGFDVKQGDLSKLKSSLQQLQKLKISDVMKINSTDAASATTMLTKIKTQAKNVEDALKNAFNAKLNTVNIQSFNRSLRTSGTTIQQIYKAFSSAGTSGENAFRSLSSQVLSTNIQLKETHGLLDKMATTLTNTIKWNVASGAVNSMSRAVEQAWGYTKSLDTSLNNIRIVTGKSAEEMGNFAVKANEAAQSLGKTTTDYTNAALIYAQQGLSDQEIEERARITLMTANVTGQSTSDVSEELTAVWNGYKVSAEQAELYIDRLAAVAATTASDLEELSTGMSKVASAAAAMGVGEDQLAAQLSTIISVTRQAPESVGTALRTVYARISDIKAGIDEDGVTLGNYSGKMAELGFNVLDAAGNLRDMGEVMEEIGGRWQNLTREQQISLAQTMAGQRQYSNLIALFDNFEKYNQALNTAQNAAGTLQEQQDIYMESTAAHLQTLKAAVENIYDSLADTDSINSIADGLAVAANLTANLIDSLGGGSAVLKSLGAIGVTVFSEQIAKGINTTITNLEIGRDNAMQFDQALQATKDWQGIPKLDETSKKLLENREQLLELSRLMTPEQFSGMQKILNDITDLGNEIKTIQSKIQPLSTVLKDFTNTSLTDVLGNKEEIDNIITEIDKPIDDLEKLQQKIENVKETFRDSFSEAQVLFNKNKNIDTFDDVFDEAQIKVISFLDTLHDLKETNAFKGLSKEAKEELDKIDIEWDELQNKLKTMSSAEDKSQAFKAFFDKISDAASTSTGEIKRKYEELLGVLNDPAIVNSLEQKQQKLEKMMNSFVTGQERMQRAANIENWAKAAGGIAQVGSAIQQIQNLGSIWKNSDLSGGQKLLQTITNLSISLPMLANGFTKATVALGLMKVATTEEQIAAIKATTTEIAHAGAISLVETASGAAAVKVQLLNKTLLLNPFILAAAAVMGLVAAYDKFTMSAKQAEQALSNFNNKQTELTKNISSTQNTVQDLESLREEYNSLSNIVGQYDQNIDALSDKEKERWEQIKQKIVDVNPDILAAYDDQHQRIIIKNDALDRTIEKLQKINDLELKEFVNGDDFTKAVEAKSVKSANARKQVEAQQKSLENDFGSTISGQNFSIIDPIIRNAAKAQDISQSEIQEFTTLSTKTIQKLTKEQKKRYNELLDLFANSKNQELSSFVSEYKDDLLQSIDEYLEAWDSANGKLIAAQEKAKQASNGDPTMLVETLMLGNENKANYERLKQAGIQDLEARLTAWAEGHKEGKAEKWDEYVDQGKKFEQDLLNIIDTSPELMSQIKTESEKFKQMAFETQQQRVDQAINIFNKIIEDNNLKEAKKDVVSALLNFDFGTNLSQQSFDKTGFVKSYSDPIIATVNDISKYISNETGKSKDSIFAQLFDINAQGVSWENIRKGLEGVTLTADNWHEALQQVIADQQVIQQQQNNIASLSVISQSGEKLQSGKNLTKKENQAYQNNLNSVIESAQKINDQDLLKSAQLLQDTWLAGSEEYQQALDKVLQKIIELKTEQARQENRAFTDEQIADIEKYATTVERVDELYQNGTIKDEAHYHALLDKAIKDQLKTLKVSGSTYKEYAKQIKESGKAVKVTADEQHSAGQEMQLTAQECEKLALQDLQLLDSLEKLQKQFKDFNYSVEDFGDMSNLQLQQQISGIVETLNHIPGLEISRQQFIQYYDTVKQVVNGVDGSLQQLRQKLALDYTANIKAVLDQEGLDSSILQPLNNYIKDLTPQDIRTHAYLNNSNFIQMLNYLLTSSADVAQQVQAMLSNLGVEAVPQYGTIPTFAGYDDGSDNGGSWGANASTSTTQYVKRITYKPINSIDTSKIPGASGGRKGGGGGGGGGKESKPDTSQKETKEELKEQIDLYHDINIELGDLNRQLENTKKKQNRLYGKDLINNLNQQNNVLDKQIGKLEEKYQLQKQDQTQQQEQLKNLGVVFDEYGKIANYMDLLKIKQTEINELIKKYNELIKEYNQTTDETRKKELNQQLSELDKKIKHEQEKLKNLHKGMDDYDKLMDDMQENEDEREAKRQEQFENNIKKFRTDIEIHLEMGEAEREWNNFRRNVLNHLDILKESDFDKLLKDAAQNYQDVLSYFDINGQMGTLEALTNQLLATQDELDEINSGGESSIYGDNKKQAMQDLKTDLNELMQQMQDVESLIDSIDEAYLNTIDDIMDQFDKQINDYKLIGELIEHDMDLLSLLYGDKNYDVMDRYYSTLRDNNLQQLDSLRQQRDFWKQEWDEAVARGDSEAAKKFEEHYKDTIGNLNSLIEESAQNLLNKYVNAIDGIFDALDKKISNGLGTDYLSAEWQLMRKNADEYLDTINSAFALQDLENKFNDALNDTKSLKAQQAIKTLMDAQLENLRTKEKLTQYDVERAEKLLQIEQARIALEDAQASKTSMRLKRDSQGNYSYEYVADQGDIAEAEQGLAAAQNDLYNFDKDRYQSNLDDMLSAWQEFQERYKEIVTDVSLSEEERVANLALLREQYGQYINDKTAENLVVRTNLMESAFADIAAIYDTDVENYNQMADNEKNILMGDLVPAWQSGIQQMADKVAGQGGFIPTCEQAFNNITEATEDYKDELDDMARVAGISLDDVKQGVDVLADSFGNLVEKNNDLLDRMNQELTSIESLKNAAHDLKEQYDDVYEAAKKAVSAIHETLQDTRADVIENDLDDEDDEQRYTDDSKHGPGVNLKKGPKVVFWEGGTGESFIDENSLSVADDERIAAATVVNPYANTSSDILNMFTSQVDTGIKSTVSTLRNNISDKINEKLKKISSLDSGGYTGQWSGDSGRLALLHQKELVLNPGDTTNLLNSVQILRSMMSSLDGSLFAKANNIKSGFFNTSNDEDGLEQNVHIDASFPNVNSKREIEEALSDLVNLAAQRAMRR